MNPFLALRSRSTIGILLFLLLAAIALSDSRDLRIILLAPAAVIFTLHTALYGLEYDALTKINSAKRS